MIQKLKSLKVQEIIKEKGIRLFSPEELRRIFSVNDWAARTFIKNHTSDLFIKLRNGLYAPKWDPPGEMEIANRLYSPSYISFEYALARYRIIPESVYSVTSAALRTTREFIVHGKAYEYHLIKQKAYRGYHSEKEGGATVLIAEPEKAVADYLYFVDLKLKKLNERLRLSGIKKTTVLRYASLFGRKSLIKLVKRIL